jgi:hypothetical protein
LFIGDDWAEDHHDVEIVNAAGDRLAARRLPEGVAGLAGVEVRAGASPHVIVGCRTGVGPGR